MTTKLKIDLSLGLLEVEGSEAFVKSIYADFKTHFAGIEVPEKSKPARRSKRTVKSSPKSDNTPQPNSPPPEPAVQAEPSLPDVEVVAEPAPKPVPKQAPKSTRTTASQTTYTYLKDLDLEAQQDQPSLVDFMDSKFPITNEERNIVFLYYLQHMLKIKPITVNHIYTCYRAAKIRAPLKIESNFDQHNWIRMAKNGNITLSKIGKNYVEKQLPKRLKS